MIMNICGESHNNIQRMINEGCTSVLHLLLVYRMIYLLSIDQCAVVVRE